MANRELPSPAQLRQLLRYDPETGKLFWREAGIEFFEDGKRSAISRWRHWNSTYPGREAFTANNGNGYKRGAFRRVDLYAHRVVWAIIHGEWPVNEIDHIDLDRTNNKICNLREAIRNENAWNAPHHKDNKSGLKGVVLDKRRGHWSAKIMKFGKLYNLGRFNTAQEAHEAYCRASKTLHEEFSRTSHNSS